MGLAGLKGDPPPKRVNESLPKAPEAVLFSHVGQQPKSLALLSPTCRFLEVFRVLQQSEQTYDGA